MISKNCNEVIMSIEHSFGVGGHVVVRKTSVGMERGVTLSHLGSNRQETRKSHMASLRGPLLPSTRGDSTSACASERKVLTQGPVPKKCLIRCGHYLKGRIPEKEDFFFLSQHPL